MNLNTGKKTKLGEELKLGDIIQGCSTHPCVVCLNTKCPTLGEFVAIHVILKEEDTIYGPDRTIIFSEGFCFPLDEMISSWGDLKVIGNIITVGGGQ